MSSYTMYHRRQARVLAVLALGALLGACGADSPSGNTVATVAPANAAAAGMSSCETCHASLVAAWLTSGHANLTNGNLNTDGTPSYGGFPSGSSCAECHDPLDDGRNLIAGLTGNTARPVVGCEACHGGGSLHVDAGGAGPIGMASLPAAVIGTTSSLQVSAQFRTCTGCHELLSATDPASTTLPGAAEHDAAGNTPLVTATPINANTNSITDTHFATPGDFTGTNGANTKDITGYTMDFTSEKVCTDCHNPHGSANINNEWAQSAHADPYAGEDPLGYFSTAWAHYNWSCDGTSNAGGCGTATAPSSRKACQRCHTTSGFNAYADALRTGDAASAKSIVAGEVSLVTYTANFKPEMLKCNGCHTDTKGTLRNPGPITADYSYLTTTNGVTYVVSEASFAYPDVDASNVCMACHTGRESGETIKNLSLDTAPSLTTFRNMNFINSHYLTAGGTVFTATGFEFDGRSYENISTYRHVQIGSSAVPNTGTGGPCVGCHMSRPGGNGDHLFLPVARSATTPGHIEGITSEVCIYCHTESGFGGLADLVNERKEEYKEAIEATIYALDKRGHYFRAANPYFWRLRTSSTSTTTAQTVLVTKGSETVNGNGTVWVSSPTPTSMRVYSTSTSTNDYFKVDNDGKYYRIIAATDTTLTLEEPYEGEDGAAENYTIITSNNNTNWLTQKGTGLLVKAAATDTDGSGNTTGRYNLGAAFNLNLLEHDPGGYVHNRIYAKRLLYDAIDWADDNLMNYSVGTTLQDKVPPGAVYRSGAMKYLLPYGVIPYTAAERP